MTSPMDKYYKPIEKLLQVNGPMGVNAIARELDLPTSSVQKWLDRQRYFEKTSSRKWDLPSDQTYPRQPPQEEKSNHGLTGELDPVIEAQLKSIQRLHEMLATQLKNTVDFITEYEIKGPEVVEVIKEVTAPVAVAEYHDPRLLQLEVDAKKLLEIFTKKDIRANIPDEYKNLVINYDHIGLVVEKGKAYATKFLEDEIFALLSGRINKLSEETVNVLKENQK